MSIEITDPERNLLLDLIGNAEDEAIRGMHHADSREFKDVLRKRLDLLASVREKILSQSKQAA